VVPEEVKKIETKPKPPETKPKPPETKPKPPVVKPPETKPKPPETKPKPPEIKPAAPVKNPIELGRRVVTAPNKNPPPPGIRLSPEEIQRRLALGATPGNRNLMPEGDTLDYEVIRRQLYKAWAQPGSVPNQVKAEVEIRMNAAGTIISRRMLRASGNAVMDRSVMDAVQSVFRIDGLTPGFIDRKSGRVTITFELTTGAG
jgi:TonB family protein